METSKQLLSAITLCDLFVSVEFKFVSAVNPNGESMVSVFQVRNLCYMVTRREKMKHTLCDLQEKIFHLQIQLLEEDIAGGKTLVKNLLAASHRSQSCQDKLTLSKI